MFRITDTDTCSKCMKKYEWVCAIPDGEEIIPGNWERLFINVTGYDLSDECYEVKCKCPRCMEIKSVKISKF